MESEDSVESPPAGPNPAETALEITVSDPVKQGDGVQAFVTYRVSLKTNMPQYRWNTSFVIRRFSDFVWLHDRLAEQNKGVIIPPLPEKNVVEKFRFSAEFIEARRRALDTFMNRIALHSQLKFSTDLQLFLEASEDVWTMETSRTAETGLFRARTTDFMQMFKDVQSSLSHVVLGKEKPEEEVDPEYEALKQYVLALEGHLAEAQRQSLRLVKRQKDLGLALAEFGEAMILLGQCEGANLGKALTELGNRSDVLAVKSQKQSSEMLLTFEEPLKEYVRMTQAVKAVMADRALALRQHQELLADLEAKRSKLGKLRQAQPPTKPDKVQEAERDIQDTQRKCDMAKERYETIIDRMKGEMVRFQEEKTRDLGCVLHEFAKTQAELAKQTASTWRTLLPAITAAKPS